MVAGLEVIGVAVVDMEVDDIVADADELELVDFWEEEEEREEVAVVEEVDAVVEDVTTAHMLFWQL